MKKQIKSQYEINAENTLKGMGVEFNPVYQGHTFPKWSEGEKEKKDQLARATFFCTFSRGKKSLSIQFFESIVNSFATYRDFKGRKQMDYNRKIAPKPSAYSVLACLTKNDPDTFENFCGDFGYNTDSRKAFDTYLVVQAEWAKVRKFFTKTEIERIKEIT